MRSVDTNVLVRLIARDDSAQVGRAEQFVGKGAWVSHTVAGSNGERGCDSLS